MNVSLGNFLFDRLTKNAFWLIMEKKHPNVAAWQSLEKVIPVLYP